MPGVDYQSDLKQIREGYADKIDGKYYIHGRSWEVKSNGKSIHPVGGADTVTLTAGEFRALKEYRIHGDTELTKTILTNQKNNGAVPQKDIEMMKHFYHKYEKVE